MAVKEYTASVITLSDRASKGIYDDVSGQLLEEIITEHFSDTGMQIIVNRNIIPDEPAELQRLLINGIESKVNFIFTTGGTGIGPRDITPEVVKPLLSKEIPGIMELIRVKYGMLFPSAAISRSIAGVAGTTIIYCLPGSPKAVTEYMQEILKTLLHCHKMVHSSDDHS